jgi:hypothetical protein
VKPFRGQVVEVASGTRAIETGANPLAVAVTMTGSRVDFARRSPANEAVESSPLVAPTCMR